MIKIPLDKYAHAFKHATIVLACMHYTKMPIGICLLISTALGILKEVYDLKKKKTKFDPMDLVANATGAILASLPSIVL